MKLQKDDPLKLYVIVLFAIAAFCEVTNALPAEPFPLKSPYRSGSEICNNSPGSLNQNEFGFFVPVPISYSDSNKTTPVYTWMYKPFIPQRPTVIVFGGGPGENLHVGSSMLTYFPRNWNVIFFDPRGMLCSRPSNPKFLQSYRFVSSILIARDAQEIAKFYGLKKWTAFGASYGSVAATIAANLFPHSIRSLVLQGTIFTTQTTDESEIPIAQAIFNRLSSKIKDSIISLSLHSEIEMIQQWAFSLVFLRSYRNESFKALDAEFETLFSKSPEDQISEVQSFLLEIKNDGYSFEDAENNSSWLRTVLSCRERADTRIDIGFVDGVFTGANPQPDVQKIEFCSQFAIPLRPYSADLYPATVPVTYFQGALDMATPEEGAYEHYRQVAQGAAQLIVAPDGGHMVMNPNDFGASYESIMDLALRGKRVRQELIKASNSERKLQLAIRASKGF